VTRIQPPSHASSLPAATKSGDSLGYLRFDLRIAAAACIGGTFC
jgi:hypothetical protein